MLSERGIEVLTGAVLLGILVSLVVTITVGIEMDTDANDFRQTIQDIVDNQGRYFLSISFSILASFLTLASAALLYIIFREYELTLAMFGTFAFIAASTIFMAADTIALALEPMAQAVASSAGPQADNLLSSARSLAIASQMSGHVGITCIALGVLSFGGLIIWSRPVPVILGWLGVVGGGLTVFVWLVTVRDFLFVIPLIGFIAIMIWLLSMGIWLISKGAKAPSLW